ncbi:MULTISPECIES: lytic polysaccharide monooxygenase [Micromonospora]|uniref:Chitin-binding protein n=1 Tax=Micromonospora solifontis TaxID=2487138 RepID=A0ABX9W997_9ACTN|nr:MULTISPECIES: lytic polysaccharide monooxygenase [Micromonospora]NES15048.1 chitin-binding protein [Micromonospora sp. PPF5-17B]NES39385.1 chitin-binding protein [Micromonospora solifontis]NES57573.1 chitin-binding protein [Micromonospora sp. PPF5-6]RNL89135.1 chitin-binding protein [Micromonospora solifontis]
MHRSRTAALLTAAATLALGAFALATNSDPAAAHGAAMTPGARTYLCWKDGLTATGEIKPNNPACAAAVAENGANSLYNWFSVLRSDAGGRTVGFIPDGKLCSGGNPNFSGYDAARNDWPLTHLTAGRTMEFRYSNWAHHPGTFYFYVTKDSWSPTRPLAWSDLEDQPFLTVTNPPSIGSPGTNDGHYYFNGTLPANKSGRHIIYSRWVRSDSQENFFGCSDVTFDGGNGEVTGIGSGSTPPPTTPVPTTPVPTTPAPTTPAPTTPPPGGDCMAVYKVVSAWGGGFQGEVEIMNHSSRTYAGWTATWTWPSGQTLTQVWNGTASTSGTTVSVSNVSYNGSIPPEGTTTFGFLANTSGTNALPTVTCTGR